MSITQMPNSKVNPSKFLFPIGRHTWAPVKGDGDKQQVKPRLHNLFTTPETLRGDLDALIV